MPFVKVIGFLVSMIFLTAVFLGIYRVGKHELEIADRVIIPEEVTKNIPNIHSDEKYKIIYQSMNWPIENETAKVFEPKINPCQIKWVMTLNSQKPHKFYNLYYLMPSFCHLNKDEIFYLQYKILTLMGKQYDFLKIDTIELASNFHLRDVHQEATNEMSLLESITSKKLIKIDAGVFSVRQ